MMYVNLIWAWGHPEVYILILPAFGIYSEIVATFSRKRLFGYASMVYAIIAIAGLSFLVWLHHFFTMGAGANVNAFFGIMTMVIAIPTGLKVFNWLFTMYRGRINFASPMIWFIGFVITFSIGGAAGVMLGVPPIDFQLHNTLFLVAHFHTMIIGGALFGYFAGIAYWFPKVFGFKLDEKLGKIAAYLWIAGFICAFTPLYILGLMGATRRLDHYDASLGWQGLFIVAGVGVVIIFAGVGVQLLMFYLSIKNRKKNLDTTGDPWNGRTLEWSTTSPAPVYNFAIIPTVADRDEFFRVKQLGVTQSKRKFTAIVMPNNSSFGIFMAGWALMFAFSVIWHFWPTIVLAIVGSIATFVLRSFNDDITHIIPAAEIEAIENKRVGALL
jgi:cytochrome o ubiquinol oxidase subunit 1